MRYAYVSEAGAVHWEDIPLGPEPPPPTIERDGETLKRSYRAEQAGVPATKGWPMECIASGVNAADAQKLRDEFNRVGVPTEVTRDGDPIYTSARHRSKALKARGLIDRQSFY